MKVINERSQLQDVVEIYERNVRSPKDPLIAENLRLLRQLPKDTCTVEDVISLTGENFRKRLGPFRCDECGGMVDIVVELGEEPDYESSTANICFPCLRNAIALEEPK